MADHKRSSQSKNKSLTIKKFDPTRGFELGSPNPKSGMLAPRPRIHENCFENEDF